ncbi:hypothetical protein GN958_ATG00377 [Phytophthora infestans]|uniref:Uncharacterized protein n=1 Tax=Phytophthora infestans TaxID=4787 RepID=A0A8S9VGD8_PHYIN|nr:hypothetical protein GN958_ATG00377 [Phytophthora infestans]
MFVRRRAHYETVIPPLRTLASRCISHSPASNIDVGEVTPGGLISAICPPIRSSPLINKDAKYS